MKDERWKMKDESWKMKDERWKIYSEKTVRNLLPMTDERWKMNDESWKMKEERWKIYSEKTVRNLFPMTVIACSLSRLCRLLNFTIYLIEVINLEKRQENGVGQTRQVSATTLEVLKIKLN